VGGGTASGPVSFMRAADASAGVIKSGGKTRRAAKMVILNADHPDILEFIRCKADEEKKAWSLIDSGYDGGFNVAGGAYDSVFYQNANHSVRVSDAFMHAALADGEWETRAVTTGQVVDRLRARSLLREMAEAAHVCGDPGIQYDTTINRWNPVKASGRIHSSNPCSEYMFLDDTACNLASLNLMRFVDDGPMRAAPRGAQFLQPRQQSGEEGRAVVERDSEEVDDDVLRRLVEQFEDLVHVRLAAVVAQDDRALEGRVIAFGVNDAELIAFFGQALEKAAG